MAGRLRVAALARAEGDTRGGAQCVGQGQGASVLITCCGITVTVFGVSSSGAVYFFDAERSTL